MVMDFLASSRKREEYSEAMGRKYNTISAHHLSEGDNPSRVNLNHHDL